jgi:peptidoglycan-associated lipoprotein
MKVKSQKSKVKSTMRAAYKLSAILLILIVAIAACNRRRPPVTAPVPPSTPTVAAPPLGPAPPPLPPTRVAEDLPVPPQPALAEDAIANRSLDDLNRDSPLRPVFFQVDSADLDDAGRMTAAANAEVLKKYPRWVVTIEGHCDERGSPEYNLALGERRAVAVKSYLVSLGVSPDRVRTVSYGKEFPFDPARTEEAFSKNRRGHFVITSN